MIKLEEIAPYLPYGVMITKDKYDNPEGVLAHHIKLLLRGVYVMYLRPLSQVTEMIEHNNDLILPCMCLEYTGEGKANEPYITQEDIEHMEYADIKKLLEWNIDIFNLIPRGLAIEKK